MSKVVQIRLLSRTYDEQIEHEFHWTSALSHSLHYVHNLVHLNPKSSAPYIYGYDERYFDISDGISSY